MFCPSCRDEYREGFTSCHDCGVALVETLPDEPTQIPIAEAEGPEKTNEKEPFRVLEVGLVLFIGFAYSVVASLHHLWHGVGHGMPNQGPDLWFDLSDIAVSVPPICVLVYVLSRRGRSLQDLGVTAQWSDVALGLALAIVSWPRLFVSLVGALLGAPWTFLGPSGLSTEVLAPISLAAILCAAAKEELLVRAYLMTEMRDLTGSAFLAVASSTCFQVLYHLFQGPWAVSHGVTFLVYALFYWKTRKATPIVLAHFAHNLWLDLH